MFERGEWQELTELMGDSKKLWQKLKVRRRCEYDGPLGVGEVTKHYAAINSGQFEHDPKEVELAQSILQGLFWDEVGGEDMADFHMPKGLWHVGAGKAPGSDGWLGEFLSLMKPVLREPVEDLLRIIMRSGETPDVFDNDLKKPFTKPGKDGTSAKDLRPVTLLCELLKMLERWLRALWTEDHKGMEEQAGFKKGYSCVGRLFVLLMIIHWNIYHEKRPVYAVLVDFSSFFESIRHDHMLVKMVKARIKRRLVRMFRGLYRNCTCRVLLKGERGKSFRYRVGVRQGSVWSPDLGAFYVEDIIVILKETSDGVKMGDERVVCMFYADDLIMLEDDPVVMQMLLDVLAEECWRVGLDVNVSKTVYTVFRKQTRGRVQPLEFAGRKIEFVPWGALYLGGMVRYDGSWALHEKHRSVKGQRALGATMQIWKRYPCMTLKFQLELAGALVASTLRYGVELWAWAGGSAIDRIDVQSLRRACGVSDRVAGDAVRWLCGRLPQQAMAWKAAYGFWMQLVDLEAERLEAMALVVGWRLHKEHCAGWVQDMLRVFVRVGFVASWDDAAELESWSVWKVRAERKRFEALVDQHWADKLHGRLQDQTSKYGFLLQVKPTWGMVDFGDVTWRWTLRRALIKFLLSEHNLMVERGRYLRPALARDARRCCGCMAAGVAVLDDEQHALDECQCVSDEREAFWTQICRSHIDRSWRAGGVVNLISSMHGLERHRRRQVWHSLAVSLCRALLGFVRQKKRR